MKQAGYCTGKAIYWVVHKQTANIDRWYFSSSRCQSFPKEKIHPELDLTFRLVVFTNGYFCHIVNLTNHFFLALKIFFFFFYKFLFKGALPWSGTVKLHLALAAVVFGFPAACVWDQSWCHKSFRAACHFWLVNLLMNPWFPADESEEEWSSVLLTVSLRTSPVRNCILKGFWHSQSCLQNS